MKAKILAYALPALILTTIHLAEAQQAGKVARIGFLDSGTASGMAVLVNLSLLRPNQEWIEIASFPIQLIGPPEGPSS